MNVKKYTLYNNLLGWLVFLIAAITYLLTLEPTTSLWDCGEFIATAFKLEVGHPPGAPLFMIVARFFSLFASDVTEVARMVNTLSAIASAFTILFLFWTITHLARRIFTNDKESLSSGSMIAIMGAGLVGSLAYTFSDTFWFSAVEGEVYASSSLFTALVFWAILKWENISDKAFSNRWIILIAYLMGLSIGVHLLNLLAIPAIVFVYYFRKHKPTNRGVIFALTISFALLASVMYGIIPGVIKMASYFELAFVNGLGMPYKTGVLIFAVLLLASLIWGIYLTHNQSKNPFYNALAFTGSFFLMGVPLFADNLVIAILIGLVVFYVIYSYGHTQYTLLNTILVSFAVIILGYSSFSMIVIRSIANPPMDENNPETVFSLLAYLNREQYGDRPLFYGQYYNAPATGVEIGKPTYTQIDGKYKITHEKNVYQYDKRFLTLFPRMYSSQSAHVEIYKDWGKIKGKPIQIRGRDGNPQTVRKPSFGENLRFFITYQVGHMYLRYFLWNFSGRQNDIQSNGGIVNGNWITGIKPFDSARLGPQDNLPKSLKEHPARNTYYMLPLLLGILGFLFHFQKKRNDFWVVFLLFFLTGIAIVIYLNQTPQQPRERDYAYAGSFYAFAIWIGLGVLAVADSMKKFLSGSARAVIATIITLALVPAIMAAENWDDHDRSGRYTARAIASNYLNSCLPDALIFTNGDNDTFPLWYAQEVEGIRTDVRVVNLMLLNVDWYIDMMRRKAYESEPIPSSLKKQQYLTGTRDIVYVTDRIKEFVDVRDIMKFVASDDPNTMVTMGNGEKMHYVPTRKFRLTVDKQKVLESGIVKPEDADKIVDVIEWEFTGNHLGKAELMVLDILANNNWERPMYFVSPGQSGTLGLEPYLQLDGFAYRLVPIRGGGTSYLTYGRIDSEYMYDNLINNFDWGRMNAEDVYLDHFHTRTFSVIRFRNNFNRLANQLLAENKVDSALTVLDKCVELGPHKNLPWDMYVTDIIETYFKAEAFDKASSLLAEFRDITEDNLEYFLNLSPNYAKGANYEIRLNLQIYQNLSQMAKNYTPGEDADAMQETLKQYFNMFSTLKM